VNTLTLVVRNYPESMVLESSFKPNMLNRKETAPLKVYPCICLTPTTLSILSQWFRQTKSVNV